MRQRTYIPRPEETEILLVDDDRDDAESVIQALLKNNVDNKLLHVTNGSDALDFLNGRGMYTAFKNTKPRLILLDLKLPGIDGLQILRSIRSNYKTRTIPVIIISTTAHAKDILECYQLGITSFVVKPGSQGEYEQEVYQLEVHKLLHNPGA